uniref:ethanolamine kinase n=1 Tax=Achlya hypogyna TaxID=1202772 RepID=A0A0A7CNP0_ACHHY|nr:secreted protein [Achlya hypogyna]
MTWILHGLMAQALVYRWYSLVQAWYTDERVDWAGFGRDAAHVAELVAAVPSPDVFGHNDFNCYNIILAADDAVPIDFEYPHANPRGVDIANHFADTGRRCAVAYLGEDCEAAARDKLHLEELLHGLVANLHWANSSFLQVTTDAGTFHYKDNMFDRWSLLGALKTCAVETVEKRTKQRLSIGDVGN